MAEKSLQDLFLMLVKDMYHGEKQIIKALPKMAENADNQQLKQALEKHRAETEQQVKRLEQVFKIMDQKPKAETCEAIRGLIEEGEEVMEEAEEGPVMDAGLIASAQAVEHYEIARYGTLCAWAKQLGMSDAASILGETLEEEKNADEKLNQIAMSNVNRQAA